jgi:hypothetical protein
MVLRTLEPRIGRLMIARGRDAADVAISTSFGQCYLQLFGVWTDAVDESKAAVMPGQRGVQQFGTRAA